MSKELEKIDVNEEFTDMAEAIVRVADAGEKLLDSGLTESAVVILIQHKAGTSKITQNQVRTVLETLPLLREYLS